MLQILQNFLSWKTAELRKCFQYWYTNLNFAFSDKTYMIFWNFIFSNIKYLFYKWFNLPFRFRKVLFHSNMTKDDKISTNREISAQKKKKKKIKKQNADITIYYQHVFFFKCIFYAFSHLGFQDSSLPLSNKKCVITLQIRSFPDL